MSKIDPDRERQRLKQLYAVMSDGELQKIGRDPEELTEWARETLRAEMAQRGLPWPDQRQLAQAPPQQDDVLAPLRDYTDQHKAAQDAALLNSARIRVHRLKREGATANDAADGVTLLVRAADLADAIQVLRNTESDGAPNDATEPPLHHEIGKPVVLRRYRDITEAMVDKTTLEGSGLVCFLYDDNLVRLDWFISNAIGGVKLVVSENDLQAASEILASAQST